MANIKGSKRGKYKITKENKGWFKNESKLAKKICSTCKKEFTSYKSKFCSHKCYTDSRVGVKRPEHSKAMSKDNLTYSGVHSWVSRNFDKLEVCDHCKTDPGKASDGRNLIHWANKTGAYLKDRGDWLCLCQSCHMKYDKPWEKREIVRNEKGQIAGFICV